MAKEALIWTEEMVEQAIVYFNDTDAVPQDDEEAMRELVEDFVKFEQIVLRGKVKKGSALTLANGFLDYARQWFSKNPRYAKIYKELSSSSQTALRSKKKKH